MESLDDFYELEKAVEKRDFTIARLEQEKAELLEGLQRIISYAEQAERRDGIRHENSAIAARARALLAKHQK